MILVVVYRLLVKLGFHQLAGCWPLEDVQAYYCWFQKLSFFCGRIFFSFVKFLLHFFHGTLFFSCEWNLHWFHYILSFFWRMDSAWLS